MCIQLSSCSSLQDKMYHVIAGIFLCLGNFLLIHAAKMQHNFYTNDFDTPVDSETWKDIVRQSINYTPKLVAGVSAHLTLHLL